MIKDLISQITIFNTLTDSEQEEIAKITHVRAFHKSNHLFYQQDEMKYFFLYWKVILKFTESVQGP